jgi:hypothetical protein
VTIAVQLPALHWFYLYIVWFLPLVLVAVLADDVPPGGEAVAAAESSRHKHGDAEPVLAGAA